MWNSVKERVRATEQYASLRKLLAEGRESIGLAGLPGASKGLVLSTLAEETGSPTVVVTPDQVSLRDMEMDLRSFGLDGVVSYPEDEMLPYDYHEPDRDLTGAQMEALHSIIMGECSVLVCTLRSYMKKVFLPGVFEGLLTGLSPGERFETTELAERLSALGYERHQIVEQKGQFAIRGAIMDIFEAGSGAPFRIEFDDDRIVSIREFDIESQRSAKGLDSVWIRPLSHLVVTEEGIDRLRGMIEVHAKGEDDETVRRMELPASRLESGISFFGMEHYAPLMNPAGVVVDYFRRPPAVVLSACQDLSRELESFNEEIEKRYNALLEEGRVYPSPDETYIRSERLSGVFQAGVTLEIHQINRRVDVDFGIEPAKSYRRNIEGLAAEITAMNRRGVQVFVYCVNEAQRRRMEEILEDAALDADFPIGEISGGFVWKEVGALFLSEDEVFGRYHRVYRKPKSRSRSLTYDPSYFKPGDFVVHVDHGIGRYMGMRVLDMGGFKTECLDIRYQGSDRLLIPVDRLKMVEKFTGADGMEPSLSRLGGARWARAREKARKSAQLIAKDLLEIYAAREVARGYAFDSDKLWQHEMEAMFPYEETPHQLQATAEVKADMEKKKLMDRLLCGDVGFGKTEVAIRAAFKAVLSGKQCAFLVPTTVLAMQHFDTLNSRLAGFPVNVAVLSRFVPRGRQKKVLEEVAKGKVDIVVGTHRLLSGDIKFRDLGLLVVDEEHRFGVKQKELFKKMKRNVDVLSMTATPIPRTLHMALSGIRDISVIDTPPRNRLPIRTEILPFDDERIEEAVMREVERGGQVFFVHNRVQSISVVEGYLRRLLPDRVRIVHAHGQMRERELERVMIDFMHRKYDLLVCTMIIEAGLDFPNVNTIIINHADKFGLAQLYQLRGRVGRSDRKAFAYLMVPENRSLTPEGMKRLKAISEFDYLGAGYRIALRDLEIRGAGNLLGHQQSGQINTVGLDMYSRMLREETGRIKGEPVEQDVEVEVKSGLDTYLDAQYIRDSEERMDIYRRLGRISDISALDDLREELKDRFGPPPATAENLLRIVRARIRAAGTGISRVDAAGRGLLKVDFREEDIPGREVLAETAARFEDRISFRAGQGLSLEIKAPGGEDAAEGSAPEGTLQDLELLLTILELYVK